MHAADDHDQGGNKKIASAPGIGTENLHPPQQAHRYQLPESYVVDAVGITAEQLSKAAVRLAAVLNQALE